MFEIIMLLAFLYAATSQFFPEGPTTTRTPRKKKEQHDGKKKGFMQRATQPVRATPGLSSKGINRTLRYAQAA